MVDDLRLLLHGVDSEAEVPLAGICRLDLEKAGAVEGVVRGSFWKKWPPGAVQDLHSSAMIV